MTRGAAATRATLKATLQKRIAVGTVAASVLSVVCILIAANAAALGETRPLELVPPSEQSAGDFAPADWYIKINSSTATDFEIESIIVTPDDQTVSPPIPIVKTIANMSTLDAVMPDEVVAARPGDVIRIATPHVLTLAPGIYAERVTLTVFDDEYDLPVTHQQLRFMDVTETRIRRISADEYSELIEPTTTITDASGKAIVFHVGASGGPPVDLSGPVRFAERVDQAASNAQNGEVMR